MATAAEDTEIEKQNWHWRNTMRPVRFFNLDARAAIPYCFLLIVPVGKLIIFIITIISTLAFHMLEQRGLTFPSALRSLRVWIIGDRRPAWLSSKYRRLKDFG